MTAYFNNAERLAALEQEARSWMGTPFYPYCQIKGRGVDCIRLIGAILVKVGAIGPLDWRKAPRYPMDWSSHNEDPVLEKWIDFYQLRYERIEQLEETVPGDVLLFAPGKVVYHMGILLDHGEVLHALRPGGVQMWPKRHPIVDRYFSHALRPVDQSEEGEES